MSRFDTLGPLHRHSLAGVIVGALLCSMGSASLPRVVLGAEEAPKPADVYVNAASDRDRGTEAKVTYGTIGDGIAAVATGGKVHVAEGDYPEDAVVGKPLVLFANIGNVSAPENAVDSIVLGEGADRAVIQPGTAEAIGVLHFRDYIDLSGGAGAALKIRVKSLAAQPVPGKDHDEVYSSAGEVILGGSSRLILDVGGLSAQCGIILPAYCGGGVTGEFAAVELTNDAGGYAAKVSYPEGGLSVELAGAPVTGFAPAGNQAVANDTPTLCWGAVSGAASYDVIVTDATGQKVCSQSGITGTSWQVAGGLPGAGDYEWRVRTCTPSGLVSQWSQPSTFTLPPPVSFLFTPAQITDLTAVLLSPSGAKSGVTGVASSGNLSATYASGKAVDGNTATAWVSPARVAAQEDWVRVDLGSVQPVNRVRVLPLSGYANLFPADMKVDVSLDDAAWTNVVTEAGYSAQDGVWYERTFVAPPAGARYVRFRGTGTLMSASHYVAFAEVEVYLADRCGAVVTTSSGDFSATFASGMAVDALTTTSWTTPARTAAQEEWLQLDLGVVQPVNRVRVFPRVGSPNLFPPDLKVDVSMNGSDWTNMVTLVGYVAVAGTWYDSGALGLTSARYVRFRGTGQPQGGSFYVALAEVEVYGVDAVLLSWTAPGNDGNTGTAASYVAKYNVGAAVTDVNWLGCTDLVGEPAPQIAGTPQTMTVDQALFTPDTTVYFGIQTISTDVVASPTSNSPWVDIPGVKPARTTDLTAVLLSPSGAKPWVTGTLSSGNLSATYASGMAVDGNTATAWVSPARAAAQEDWVRVDLGSVQTVNRVRALPWAGYASLFPQDLKVDVSLDDATWTNVVTEVAYTAQDGVWYDRTFVTPPAGARYVRFRGTGTLISGNHYVAFAEVEVFVAGRSGATGTTSSGDSSAALASGMVADGNTATAWSSPARNAAQEDWVQVDLGSVRPVNKVRVFPRTGFANLFPQDLKVDVSENGTVWTNIVTLAAYVAVPGTWYDSGALTLRSARYVRFRGTGQLQGGQFYVSFAEVEIHGVDSVLLNWTAPGDDGDIGTAASYDAKWLLDVEVTDLNWLGCNALLGEPVPQVAGTPQSMIVDQSTFAPDTTVYFGLQTTDAGANVSPTSNSPWVRIPGVKPAQITDLTAVLMMPGGAKFGVTGTASSGNLSATYASGMAVDGSTSTAWVSPARPAAQEDWVRVDLGSVQPVNRVRALPWSGYAALFPADLKVDVSLDDATWTNVVTEAAYTAQDGVWYDTTFAVPVGGARYVRFRGTGTLLSGNHYVAFAEVAVFVAGKSGAVGTTSSGDFSAAFASGMAVDGMTTTAWSTPARNAAQEEWLQLDLGSVQPVNQVRVFPRTGFANLFPSDLKVDVSENGTVWTNIVTLAAYVAVPGTWYDSGALTLRSARYVRFRGTGQLQGGKFYVSFAEVEVYGEGAVLLSWTAPGDNGDIGTALSYEAKWLQGAAVTDLNWGGCNDLPNEPVPLIAGTPQTMIVSLSTFTPSTTVFFGIQTTDVGANTSPTSNSPSVTIPGAPFADVTPPAQITDLAAVLLLPSGTRSGVVGVATSGNLNATFAGGKAVDGDVTTSWVSPARTAAQEEWIRLDLGSVQQVNRVRVLPRAGFPNLFPSNLKVDVSSDGTTWTTVVTETGYTATDGVWYDKTFAAPPAGAQWVRLRGTGAGVSGSFYVAFAEVEVYAPGVQTTIPGRAAGTASSGDFSPAFASGMAVDGNATTSWTTPARGAAQEEWLSVDLGSVQPVNRVRALPRAGYATTFPSDLKVDVSVNGTDWTNVVTEAAYAATDGVWYDKTLTAMVSAQFVRFRGTGRLVTGNYYMSFAEVEAYVVGAKAASTGTLSSGDLSATYASGMATDGSTTTSWVSPARVAAQEEWLRVDLGTVQLVNRVRALPFSGYANLFPADLKVDLSVDGAAWTNVVTTAAYVAQNGVWYEAMFPAGSARYVRFRGTGLPQGANFYMALAEVEVYGLPVTHLSWTAPGDDGNSGTATAYDVRYRIGGAVTDVNWASCTPLAGAPAPHLAGTLESMVPDLSAVGSGQTVFFGIMTADEVPNWSVLSNSPSSVKP